ncbi:MAG: hypothetical protein JJE52_04130 [Acidimicrobiia bacterium]|nr:hypothetical protein [Acidimicrobiia bacterium]
MAFGQASGPPATAAQLQELADLFAQVGFESFREARHPYGLTQRQAGGKFTRGEADELIERLTAEVEEGGVGAEPPETPSPPTRRTPPARAARAPTAVAPPPPEPEPDPGQVVLAFPDEMLADELTRRGWTCTPPALT